MLEQRKQIEETLERLNYKIARYEENAGRIKNSIEEDSVAGYVGSLDGYNLTNTHTHPERHQYK